MASCVHYDQSVDKITFDDNFAARWAFCKVSHTLVDVDYFHIAKKSFLLCDMSLPQNHSVNDLQMACAEC